MQFDLNRSILYDTVKYFEIYFNKNTIDADISFYGYDEILFFKYYSRIKIENSFPKEFFVFFKYVNSIRTSALMDFLLKNFNNIQSVESLISRLFNNKDVLFDYIMNFYFHSEKPVGYADIFELDVEADHKLSIGIFFNEHDRVIERLISDVEIVYKHISELYRQNNLVLKNFQLSKSLLGQIKNTLGFKLENEITVYGISLLDQYALRYSINTKENIYILGLRCGDFLKNNRYAHVNFKSVAYVLKSDLAMKVIDLLDEYEKLTRANIYNLLDDYSQASVYRVLSELTKEKVTYVYEVTNKCIYYKINKEYFKVASALMNNKLSHYMDGGKTS